MGESAVSRVAVSPTIIDRIDHATMQFATVGPASVVLTTMRQTSISTTFIDLIDLATNSKKTISTCYMYDA